jgi:hypothetical protein
MNFQFLLASALTSMAAAADYAGNGNSGTYTVEAYGQTVSVQANGSFAASGEGDLSDGSGSVAANGHAKVETEWGTINVGGAVAGRGGINGDHVFVEGAIDGEGTGPYGAFARGTAAGGVYVDLDKQTATAQGAVSGEAGALGYAVKGAAAGHATADIHGNFYVAGAVNGCLKHPDGTLDCYNESGEYIGTVALDGSIVQLAERAKIRFLKGGKSGGSGSGGSSGTSSTKDDKDQSSDGSQMAIGLLVSVLAGLTAFFL